MDSHHHNFSSCTRRKLSGLRKSNGIFQYLFNSNYYHMTQILVLLVIFSKIVSSDSNLNSSPRNALQKSVPDQIAMPAEHRLGIPPGYHGPPPPPHAQHGPPPGFHHGGPSPPPHHLQGPHHGGPPPPPIHGPPQDEAWPLQSHSDMPQIKTLQVQCEKSHMRVNIEFDRPFYGMIFSKGYYSDPHCVHLAPGSGHLSATFDIYLDACGMSSSANGLGAYGPAPSGTFVENTIIIQYDPLVQEVWDQARKLRCTWYDFYEKSVTFRPFQVDMLHAVTANFLGDNLQCWMQIQVGKGPWASEVSGIVKIGQTMTMVLAIKDDENKFDMLVRNCVAHDGKRAPIQLVDQYGCVTRPKIMSRFHKIKNFGSSASVVSYAYFQAFKFPDSMNVHFQCVIQVCRFQCPEPKCGHGEGLEHYGGPPGLPDPRIPHGAYSEKKETLAIAAPSGNSDNNSGSSEEPQQAAQSQQRPQQLPPQKPQQQPPQQNNNHHPNHKSSPPPLPPLPPQHQKQPHHAHPLPMPLPAKPSHVMLPPLPPHPGYSTVKREGMVIDEQKSGDERSDDDEDDEQQSHERKEPSFAALGGRPRSVDFNQRGPRNQRSISGFGDDDHSFVVHVSHVYKRSAQEMTDVSTTRVIQVVAPGDVAFNLGGASSGNSSIGEGVVIESSGRELEGICMSVSSFVGGLVLLLLLLVVASLVAAFLFVRVRSIHSTHKSASSHGLFNYEPPSPEYAIKTSS